MMTPQAFALLRQHHDAPGVLRYHSQVSIKDDTGHTWQVLLFKVFNENRLQNIHLRLVGFPGVVEFAHPQALEILTAKGKILTASDVYAEKSPASNVGEYRFADVLPKLETIDVLKLYIPLEGKKSLILTIPQEVVTEWQWLITDFN
ncbi:MAG: DUF3122 domain-containing protein [Scytonema sp. PMC 1069.18]|nr:DUF3122 domain-containing protein [Scytonema sp. PMC 1069.18]MEC4881377.1 DUF3122 domain-containing protein [Scytonema sp. PMC 1070.18]